MFIAYLSKRSTSTAVVTVKGKDRVKTFIEILKSSLMLVFKCEGCNNHNIIKIGTQHKGKDFEAKGSKSLKVLTIT